MRYRSPSYKLFAICNYIALGILGLLCIFPVVHVFAVSLSSRAAATANIVNFWPIGFTLDAYEQTLANSHFLRALSIGVMRTVLGTGISIAVLLLAAYSLSKPDRKFGGRSAYAWYFVVPMLFSGGMIPSYLIVKETGLLNTIWALVIPGAASAYLLILMLNFFRTVPIELEEAALIDGAGHFTTLFRVYLPVSMAGIATISLFEMVAHWNSWFDGMIYLTNPKDYPLATFLQSIIGKENFQEAGIQAEDIANISSRTVKASQIFIGALPILAVYPFLQKYFVKGIVLGSVKG
ncbi:carbohydrate ABC transporter permease [Paenibacillus pasadenensis]|uniref:carbohydrate ABC transporter permease n=1 Tax=Paenibacillus pasadenensis TaxID=217090 RepID=UPI00203C50AA|nr:carbohydrate ABC transporter permease [Paenibacillus pasadenensis]MCM3746599.1 carbohydrate ABC transporter permease [Paenibacillus pasadenensis]